MDNFLTVLIKDYKVYFAVLFFALISEISYLFAYSTSFGITSIFSYLTLSNIVTFTAYPIAILVTMLLCLFIAMFLLSPLIKYLSTKIIGKKGDIFDVSLTLIVGILVISVLGWMYNYRIAFIGIPSLSVVLYVCSRYNSEIEKYLNIGLVLLLSPLISYYFGCKDASLILKGEKYFYSSIKIDKSEKKLKLIGYINSHYFLIDMENKNVIILNDLPLIYLQKFEKKNKSS